MFTIFGCGYVRMQSVDTQEVFAVKKRAVQRRYRGRPLPRLCAEVCEVLNRVRAAFGGLPMHAVAGRTDVKALEAEIEQVAGKLLRGEGDAAEWRLVLDAYEAAWMAALRELRRDGRRAA